MKQAFKCLKCGEVFEQDISPVIPVCPHFCDRCAEKSKQDKELKFKRGS